MTPVLGAAAESFVVTADMFTGLTSAINSNAAVIVPVGIGIMAIMVAIGVIPRILYKFL